MWEATSIVHLSVFHLWVRGGDPTLDVVVYFYLNIKLIPDSQCHFNSTGATWFIFLCSVTTISYRSLSFFNVVTLSSYCSSALRCEANGLSRVFSRRFPIRWTRCSDWLRTTVKAFWWTSLLWFAGQRRQLIFTPFVCSVSGCRCGASHWCSTTIITNLNNLKLDSTCRRARPSFAFDCIRLQSPLHFTECRRGSSNLRRLDSVCCLHLHSSR